MTVKIFAHQNTFKSRLSGQSLRTLGAAFAYHEALGQAQRSHSAQYISPGIPFLHVTFNLLTLIAHMF